MDLSQGFLAEIPDLGDKTAPRPAIGELRISPEAIEARLRRVFQPNVKGQYKVSSAIVEQWKNKKTGRKTLEQMFQSCGYSPTGVGEIGPT